MAKKVDKYIKLAIRGGQANPAPPVGTALGPAGIPIMEFVKAFNDKTSDQMGTLLPVVISVFEDKTFSFVIKKPPVSELIKQAMKLEKGSQKPGRESAGKITLQQAKDIATIKMDDLNSKNVDQAAKIVLGTARSMGIQTEN